MRIGFAAKALLFVSMIVAIPATASANIFLSVSIAPPPLPVYVQPICPGEGYIWTPGYWAYGDYGYFWVPGTWVLAPEPGLLWTPGYWGWTDGFFIFHDGYWGPRVGFYGGINYGFGYVGVGYLGGYWSNRAFFYNRSVNNVTNIRNVYNKTVIVNNVTVNNVSYNGGRGGITARPGPDEEAATRERHLRPTAIQTQHLQSASSNRQFYESVNRGKPPIAATVRPAEFRGHGITSAKAAAKSYQPPTARPTGQAVTSNASSRTPVHPNVSQPVRPAPVTTGNPTVDRRYQQQQQALTAKQEQESRSLQRKQERDHQRLDQARANDARRQQVEQKHQQQVQRLDQRHTLDQQRLQQRQLPSNPQSRPARGKP